MLYNWNNLESELQNKNNQAYPKRVWLIMQNYSCSSHLIQERDPPTRLLYDCASWENEWNRIILEATTGYHTYILNDWTGVHLESISAGQRGYPEKDWGTEKRINKHQLWNRWYVILH